MSKLINEIVNNAKNSPDKYNIICNGYFYDFRQNVFNHKMDEKFVEMFLDGDGNELVSKACAPHSSSMLGYNFFHWIGKEHELKIAFDDETKTYNQVLFEVKMPVLKGRSKPANMDIVLRNTDGDWLFIESKFTEYVKCSKFSISESYLEGEKYFYNGNKWTNFIKNYDVNENKQYWDGIKQEICHLIGITNWINKTTKISDSFYDDKCDVRFINLVFEPKKDYKKDYECFSNYKNLYNELHNKLEGEKMIPDELKMEFMTYSKLFENIKNDLPDKLKEYLEDRYMKFANK